MIPYSRQNINTQDVRAVTKVLRSDFLTQGKETPEFESKLAKFCSAKYAITTTNGTSALHLAYLAAGLKSGDEVITTPNTFVATTNMLLVVGAKPIFCDIRLDTYNIDDKKVEKLITKKTKAIVAVHFAGQPCDMKQLAKIARKHQLVLIEDASHALGSKYQGKKIGSLSDMTIFSFHAIKSIATGEGGAVVTNQQDFYQQLKLLRSHGITKDSSGKNVMTQLGYNYRLTEIQAALGISQLKRLNSFTKTRQQVVQWYRRELGDFEPVILPKNLTGNLSAQHLYVIRVTNPKNRQPLFDFLRGKGIGVSFHFPLVYKHPYYQKIGYRSLRLPNAEKYHNSCISLPCHTLLKQKDVKNISQAIKQFFE